MTPSKPSARCVCAPARVACVNRHVAFWASACSIEQLCDSRSDPTSGSGRFCFRERRNGPGGRRGGSIHATLTRTALMHPIAIYHEHPDWFKPLFTRVGAARRAVCQARRRGACLRPAERDVPFSLVFNRASPSAYLRGHRQTTFHTLHWLRHLERLGVPVVNGSTVYSFELSKAAQLDLLDELGLPFPRASRSTIRRARSKRHRGFAIRSSSKRTSAAAARVSCATRTRRRWPAPCYVVT